jgi:hypothetical protein
MVAAAVVAVCLSFVVRAERLRAVATGQVQRYVRVIRNQSQGAATAEDWRAYQKAQQDLLKADFLESFGLVVLILVPVVGVALVLRLRKVAPSPSE